MASQRCPLPYDFLPAVPSFAVASDQLTDGERLPSTCCHSEMGVGGDNLSPHLAWSGYPDNTQSFAVTCFDPDAPTGSGFWHWLVIDIPVSVTDLPLGAGTDESRLPHGARHARNDFGTYDYGGAAPPPGLPHRYAFAVHALDCPKLDVPAEASPAFVGFNLTSHAVGRALVVSEYGR